MFKVLLRLRRKRIFGTWVAPRLLSLKGQGKPCVFARPDRLWLTVKGELFPRFFVQSTSSWVRVWNVKAVKAGGDLEVLTFWPMPWFSYLTGVILLRDGLQLFCGAMDFSTGFCGLLDNPRRCHWIRGTNGGVCNLWGSKRFWSSQFSLSLAQAHAESSQTSIAFQSVEKDSLGCHRFRLFLREEKGLRSSCSSVSSLQRITPKGYFLSGLVIPYLYGLKPKEGTILLWRQVQG